MLTTKLIGGLLMPVPIILGLLLLGLLLGGFTRAQRSGWLLSALAAVLLLVLSLPQVPERLLAPLENRYAPLHQPPPAQWIVVLGGGVKQAPALPANSQLEPSSLARLNEGMRLHRLIPEARLAVSGGLFRDGVSSARAMADTARSLGVDSARLVVLDRPRTTAEEAREVAARLRPGDQVILVTSAFHMRRAVALFEGQDITVIPAPTGHLVDPGRANRHIGAQLPQTKYLAFSETAIWEYIGLLWARWRGDL